MSPSFTEQLSTAHTSLTLWTTSYRRHTKYSRMRLNYPMTMLRLLESAPRHSRRSKRISIDG